MKILVFIVLVIACAAALLWAAHKTVDEDERARHRREVERRKRRSPETRLATRDSVLSRKEEVWAARRQHAATGVDDLNRFRPRSETRGVPEYDGYSRRDRHHVQQLDARVHEDSLGDEELTITAVEIAPDAEEPEEQAPGASR